MWFASGSEAGGNDLGDFARMKVCFIYAEVIIV